MLSNDNCEEWIPIEIIDEEDIGQALSEAHDIEVIFNCLVFKNYCHKSYQNPMLL